MKIRMMYARFLQAYKGKNNMKTEVVIPFTFDTDPIEKNLELMGLKEIEKKVNEVIENGVLSALPTTPCNSYYNQKSHVDWKKYIDYRTDIFFENHSEEIIELSAVLLAQRANRKKTFKQVLAELKENQQESECE